MSMIAKVSARKHLFIYLRIYLYIPIFVYPHKLESLTCIVNDGPSGSVRALPASGDPFGKYVLNLLFAPF